MGSGHSDPLIKGHYDYCYHWTYWELTRWYFILQDYNLRNIDLAGGFGVIFI